MMIRKLAVAVLAVVFSSIDGCDHGRENTADTAATARIHTPESATSVAPTAAAHRDNSGERAQPRAATLFGIADTASRRIVAFDASGTMKPLMPDFRSKLHDALQNLDPETAFNLLFFTADGFKAATDHWLMADQAGKQRADDFAKQIEPAGSTDPVPGIRHAFALKPQVIYLGTDGDFPSNRQVQETIRQLNADHKVRIHTILLGFDSPEIEQTLREIANENGGKFVQISIQGK